ncbi:YtcA family lipoprotein [Swingsia samuiensis]|uniref:Uncharacterized protein YtcA n=1 Tax=Swingsia samuiensis TaxID=1293412 RepID=A0A4Y6UI43_9PROT|nr:YtcA family lipoprotein [Swingsia samuiensis]QDH17182.1 hypothetical protein E3D00_06090 [Swingsia samuiensis]
MRVPLIFVFLLLSSCTSAPSFPIVGAYFPAWMLCGFLGIIITFTLRYIFILLNINNLLRYHLFTYTALGTIAALLIWGTFFGP